jgi:hypothetical protein
MIAPESHPPDPVPGAGGTGGEAPPDQPVTTLRGASVDVDMRGAGRVVLVVCLVALTVIGVILLIAGIHNNDQANSLKRGGVPVTVTVTHCLGLIGGTGAQGAGYSCTGTYRFDGRQYHQAIPGLAFHAQGSSLRGVVAPGDPELLSTPGQLAHQHASWRVFILPALLLLAAVVVTGILILRRSRAAVPRGTDAVDPR